MVKYCLIVIERGAFVFPVVCIAAFLVVFFLLRALLRRAARLFRMRREGPDRWRNQTRLYHYVREASPRWLAPQRFDIYLPEHRVAIEYQGEQHFRPVRRFGGWRGLWRTWRLDRLKRRKCRRNGVRLVYFTYRESLTQALVRKRLRRFL